MKGDRERALALARTAGVFKQKVVAPLIGITTVHDLV
jgi:hypothetical protein